MRNLCKKFLNAAKRFCFRIGLLVLLYCHFITIPIKPCNLAWFISVQPLQVRFQIDFKAEVWKFCRILLRSPRSICKVVLMAGSCVGVMPIGSFWRRLYVFHNFDLLTDRPFEYLSRLFSCAGILPQDFLPWVNKAAQYHVGVISHQIHVLIIQVCFCPGLFYVDIVACAVHRPARNKSSA